MGMEEIDDEEYEETLKGLLVRKKREIKEKDPWKMKQKLIVYGVQKGYDYGLIRKVIESFEWF
jgi:regulatory protein